MSAILNTDLDKYFYDLSERHFRNMIYRFEDTIANAGEKKYSITYQMQIKAIAQLEIVGSQPFTSELRKQFLHFYKIDKRRVISELIPIIEELQKTYAEERGMILRKRFEKLERLLPFIEWIQKFSPTTQARILKVVFVIGGVIYNIATFLRLMKPITFNLRFVEPMATETDMKKIVKDLIKYLNINRFITYANYKLDIAEKEQEDIFESLGLQKIEKLVPNLSEFEKLKIQLSEGQIDDVWVHLLSLTNDNNFRNDILIIKQRYIAYKKQLELETIEIDEFIVEKTRITKSLLEFIDIQRDLEKEKKEV